LILKVSVGDGKLAIPNTIVPNLRQKLSLDHGIAALTAANEGLRTQAPVELVTIDLNEAASALGEIIGLTVKEDVLDRIFNHFCIGK
jgi:tRNA modification GTPase